MTEIVANLPSPTIYERIFNGELSSYPLYKDDQLGLMAFLDIHPATPGQTLVIPEEAVDHISDLPEYRYLQLSSLTRALSSRLRTRLQPQRVVEGVYGFQVPHAHRILIPSYERGDHAAINDPFRMSSPVDHQALANMQNRLELDRSDYLALRGHLGRLGQVAVRTPYIDFSLD